MFALKGRATGGFGFTFLLPGLALLVWFSVVVLPVAIFLWQIRHSVAGLGPPHVSYLEFVRGSRFWDVVQIGLDRVGWRVEGWIRIVFGPGKWVSAVIPHQGLMSWSWIALSYAPFSVPAWAFVGWGLDGLIRRAVVGWRSAVASALLVVAVGLWLPEARVWMLLFAIPALGWWRER